MTNMNDFEKMIMATNEVLKKMQNLTTEKNAAKFACYQDKYNEVRADLVKCTNIFKQLAVPNKELKFTFKYILGHQHHVRILKALEAGNIYMGSNLLYFNRRSYNLCVADSNWFAKQQQIVEYTPQWFLNHWDDMRDTFLTAFQEALMNMLCDVIINEKFKYSDARTIMEEIQAMMG